MFTTIRRRSAKGFALLAFSALAIGPLPVAAEDIVLPPALDPADFIVFDEAKADLGQLLFYDKILSGNQNISCGTCHHHTLGGGDGVSLAIGEGGRGLGPARRVASAVDQPLERVPRNAPPLWNLGHTSISAVFHDGRLAVDPAQPSGFAGPAKDKMPLGLNSILAAQALFPPTSATEMAGQGDENEVAVNTAVHLTRTWPLLAARVQAVPEYRSLFTAAFDDVTAPEDITMVHIVNAIASFIGTEWQNFDSPFDRYLAGDTAALNDAQRRGMDLFFGEAQCATCHSGPLLSDQSFHALALPDFGPGKVHRENRPSHDPGRFMQTGDPDDLYRFRTPMLRNVALTAPYGHNGAFDTLEGIVRHHANPLASLARWQPEAAHLPPVDGFERVDFEVMEDRPEMTRQRSTFDIQPVALTARDVADLVAFLEALTGETALTRPRGVPERVPSGLPVDLR